MGPVASSSSVSLSSAQNSALAAIATSSEQLTQDAAQIAAPGNENFTAPLLLSTQSEILTGAAADVISTSDQMQGTLINVYA